MIGPSFTPPESGRAKEALKHFATAFTFLIFGIVALITNGELLSKGETSAGSVIAGLHFITLGWLSLSIFGALQVFMGVALGVSTPCNALPAWTRRLWSAGVIFFTSGLFKHQILLIGPGTLLLGAGLALMSAQVVPALIRAKRGHLTRGYTAVGLSSLWCAWSLGTLAGLARGGFVPFGLPPGYFSAHVLIAVFGWVGAMVAGVGSHLVPMFALSKPCSNLPIKIALPVWAGIPICAAISAFYPNPWFTIAWTLAGSSSALWIVQFSLYLLNRLRKERDFGMQMAISATAFLAVAWIVLFTLHAPQSFVGVIVIGWLSLFTLGIYHRVIPFLVWYLRFAQGAGRGPMIKVKDLLDERLTAMTFGGSAIGIAVWSAGLVLHAHSAICLGALLLLLGVLTCLFQLRPLTASPKKGAPNGIHSGFPAHAIKPSH